MNLSSLFILVKKPVNTRQFGFREPHDKLPELLVKFVFDPGHVFSFFSYAALDAGKTYLQRLIQQKDRVTMFDPPFECPAVVAVDDPAVFC